MDQAFDEFAMRNLVGLLKFAAVLTGDQALGEEIVQDVLVRAQQRWDRIGAMDRPDSYVRRMVVNEFVTWRRKWSRLIPHADVPETFAETDPAVFVADRHDLAVRLARLPPRQRAVIVLRFYASLTDVEIAATLGCSVGTVRSHASRALESLRIEQSDPAHGRPNKPSKERKSVAYDR